MPPSTRPARPEINLAPLIDITMVMLIILMVSVPLELGHMRVKVPGESAELPPPAADPPTVLAVYPHDSAHCALAHCFAIDREPVAEAALAEALAERLRNDARRRVLVDAAAAVPLGAVVDAMDAAKQAGALRIGLARVDAEGPRLPQLD